jgi:hypothetical protein
LTACDNVGTQPVGVFDCRLPNPSLVGVVYERLGHGPTLSVRLFPGNVKPNQASLVAKVGQQASLADFDRLGFDSVVRRADVKSQNVSYNDLVSLRKERCAVTQTDALNWLIRERISVSIRQEPEEFGLVPAGLAVRRNNQQQTNRDENGDRDDRV